MPATVVMWVLTLILLYCWHGYWLPAVLFRLSRQGRTIIFSIHQPGLSIYNLFDRLMLLADGYCIFHGPASEALMFFQSVGLIMWCFFSNLVAVRKVVSIHKNTICACIAQNHIQNPWNSHPTAYLPYYVSQHSLCFLIHLLTLSIPKATI